MAKLIKVIWRLDYNISYAYLNSIGTSAKILSDTVPKFIHTLSEGVANHALIGERKARGEYVIMGIELNTLNCTLEWLEGIELDRLLIHDNFRNSEKIAKSLLQNNEVKMINRAGIRFFFLEKQTGVLNSNSFHDVFVHSQALDRCKRALGPPTDVGVVVEGARDDKLSYRATFGPSALKNINMSLTPGGLDHLMTENEYRTIFFSYSIFCDLDIYETNFMMVDASIYKWATSKLEIATEFAHSFAPTATAREK